MLEILALITALVLPGRSSAALLILIDVGVILLVMLSLKVFHNIVFSLLLHRFLAQSLNLGGKYCMSPEAEERVIWIVLQHSYMSQQCSV